MRDAPAQEVGALDQAGRLREVCPARVTTSRTFNVLSRVQAERLRTVIVYGNPKLWATRERRDASHKRRQSVLWTEINVLGGPRVVAADDTGGFCWNLRSLEQQSVASGVRGSRWRRQALARRELAERRLERLAERRLERLAERLAERFPRVGAPAE